MRRRRFWVVTLSLLPLQAIDAIGSRSRPFGRRWSIAAGAWLRKAARLGIDL